MRDEKEKKDKDERIEVVLPEIEGTELVRPTEDVMELLEKYKFVPGKGADQVTSAVEEPEVKVSFSVGVIPDAELRQLMLRIEEAARAEGLREPDLGRVADATQRELDRVQLEVDKE